MRPVDDKDIKEAASTLCAMMQKQPLQAPHPGWGFTHLPIPSILDHTREARRASLFAHPKPRRTSDIPQSHITGVSFHRSNQKWAVQIRINGHRANLGYHDTPIQAGSLLLDVLNTLSGVPNNNKQAYNYACEINKKTTIHPDDLAKRTARLHKELSALAAPERSHYKPGF
ncbi:MAG: hypothetical protein P1U40_05830 [Coxiellaceae bacterium]|nr:hypothetical protein [Coxiellaceae bacterium]